MSLPLFLPCAAGVEAWLAEEVREVLPQAEVQPARGGVSLLGSEAVVMALNLECRLPQRVLVGVAAGPYRSEYVLCTLRRRFDQIMQQSRTAAWLSRYGKGAAHAAAPFRV